MEKYKIAAAEDWIIASTKDLSDRKDITSPFYFILVDYQELILEKKTSSFKRTIEKINDESRIEDASLYLSDIQDENHQIIFHSIEIIRDGKRINVLNEDRISINQRETSLENHMTDRVSTISFSIDDLRVGDIIDYQATTVIHASEHPLKAKYFYSLFWLRWNCNVCCQDIRIINRSSKAIQVQHCYIDEGKRQSITKSISDNETFHEEYTDLKPESMENVVPEWLWSDFVLVTTSAEWKELSAYLYNYYKSTGVFENNIEVNNIDCIKQDDSKEDQIISIIRFVQNEIRYKGENHGIFTHTPKKSESTLSKRYGDCKDKANLLVSLLKLINVNAYLALVNTDYGIKVGQLIPSTYHFNHMIVCIEYNNKVYYFDPTIKKQAGNLANSTTLNYGYGLVLSEEGRPLKKIPHNISNKVYYLKHTYDFSKELTPENTLCIRRHYYAHRADNMRYYLNSNEKGVLEKDYLLDAKDNAELSLSILKPLSIIKDNKETNILETEELYAIDNLTNDDDNKKLQMSTNIYYEFPTTTSEEHPVRIELDGEIVHEIEVVYKDDAVNINEAEKIQNEWFTYKDKVLSNRNILHFTTTVTPHKEYVESQQLKTYFDDVEKVRQRSGNNFPYKSGDTTYLSNYASWMFRTLFIIVFFITLVNILND